MATKARHSPPGQWAGNKVVKQPYACIYSVFTTSPPHIVKTETIANHHTSLAGGQKSTIFFYICNNLTEGGESGEYKKNTRVFTTWDEVVKVVKVVKQSTARSSIDIEAHRVPQNKLLLEGL